MENYQRGMLSRLRSGRQELVSVHDEGQMNAPKAQEWHQRVSMEDERRGSSEDPYRQISCVEGE